jgi:hypothetical protein
MFKYNSSTNVQLQQAETAPLLFSYNKQSSIAVQLQQAQLHYCSVITRPPLVFNYNRRRLLNYCSVITGTHSFTTVQLHKAQLHCCSVTTGTHSSTTVQLQ